jgi:hypothetical protein
VFCRSAVGAVTEADALPANDNSPAAPNPAAPNTGTALLFLFARFE